MASGAGTTLEGEIKEVYVKEKDPSLHETTEPVWQISDNHQQNLSFTDVRPADITVRNLEVQVDAATSLVETLEAKFIRLKVDDVEGGGMGSRRKIILKDVSADFPSGTLTAIIGGSGSGKTTLLNALSHRVRGSNLTITGSIRYNGSPDLLTITSAYVTQTDVLLPSLTVRETLLYAASLRLPSSTTSQQRSQLVEEIILELGLKECADTRVGDGFKKGGCSGGERRRVSIGVQMLRNPSILFLDEPTTGLDATSAFHLVKTLHHLANTGRTIITTIHQPRSDIFFLFDRLTLLSRGNIAYTGSTSECLSWFDGLLPGVLKPHVNPADYLIDIVAVDIRSEEAEHESQARVNRLLIAWIQESEARLSTDKTAPEKARAPDERTRRMRQSAPFLRQVQVLTSRTLLTTIRDPFGLVGSWSEAVFMGLACGLIFYKIPHDLAGIRSSQAAFYLLCAGHSYLFVLFEIYRLTRVDIQLFDRERGENLVSGVAWVVSRRIAHGILEDVIVPFLFCFIFSYLAGFQGNIGIFFAIVLLIHYIAVTFALFCASLLRDFAWAALMANLFATVQTYGSGFFAQAATIPVYVRWMKYVSYFFYGFGAASVNEFAGRYYDCPYGDAQTNPACLQYRGSFILENLSFADNWLTVPLCALLGFVAFFSISSCSFLQFWTVDVHFSAAQTRKDDTDASAGKEVMRVSREGDGTKMVDVELVDLALEIHKPSLSRGKGRTLNVLGGVSTKFQAGELNVIFGPSGSGKSSLLNTMARRLRSSLLTRYRTSGAMLFNGVQPTDKVVQSLCSYVTQDDSALLPYLTVRETLRFAAGLRLPKWMSNQEKARRAEDVLLKMGLKDCADVLVGNELLKGISGGEKRRVSIAVQVLTEPQILILDEPTSGLDAFTASSIIRVLEGLAREGRTVIATIHQSRSDLFPHFANVLLLAKGGQVAYSGKGSNMLPHFASLGHKCPSTTNPADFALDMVSVDLREEENEVVSRAKVENLIRQFAATRESEKPVVRNIEAGELGLADLEGREPTPMYIAVPILIRRGLLGFKRRPDLAVARIMQVVGLSTFIALFFAPLKTDYASFQNRLGVIQQILALYFVGLLQNVGQYPLERDAFYREYADRAYSVDSFFFVYLILEIPFEIASGLLFSLLLFAVNLQRSVSMYFLTALVSFCIVSCGESLGIIFNTLISDSTGFALNLTSSFISIAIMAAGVLSIDMPAFFNGVNYISPLKYAAASLSIKTFKGFEFTCTETQRLPDGNCPIQTGQQVLDLFKYHTSLASNIGALVGVAVAYRLIAYIVLRLFKANFGVTRKDAGPRSDRAQAVSN